MKNVEKVKNEFGFDFSACQRISEMSPAAYIKWMYESTENNGTLVVPDWSEEGVSDTTGWLSCEMQWTEADRDRAIADVEALIDALTKIAKTYIGLSAEDREKCEDFLSGDLRAVWEKYLRPLNPDVFDREVIRDLSERVELIRDREKLERKAGLGTPLTEAEKESLRIVEDVTLEPGECEIIDAYNRFVEDRAAERVGKGPFACSFVITAWRFWRLKTFGAEFMIPYEAMRLAHTMTLHTYAKNFERIEPVN